MAEFKDKLFELRTQAGLTQREFANKIHVSCASIGMYETGKRMPTADVEEAIADYFHISLDELRGRSATRNYSISQEEYFIIEAYRELPKAEKDMVKRMLAYNELMQQKSMANGSIATGKKLISELTNYKGVKNEDRKDTLG